jgi:hypothetical protein
MDAKDVTPEMHDEFYRFIGTSYDRPRFTLHYKTDAPLSLRALLYFPEGKPGMQELDMNFSCSVRPSGITQVNQSTQITVFTAALQMSPVFSARARTCPTEALLKSVGSNHVQPKFFIVYLARVGH